MSSNFQKSKRSKNKKSGIDNDDDTYTQAQTRSDTQKLLDKFMCMNILPIIFFFSIYF